MGPHSRGGRQLAPAFANYTSSSAACYWRQRAQRTDVHTSLARKAPPENSPKMLSGGKDFFAHDGGVRHLVSQRLRDCALGVGQKLYPDRRGPDGLGQLGLVGPLRTRPMPSKALRVASTLGHHGSATRVPPMQSRLKNAPAPPRTPRIPTAGRQ